MPPTPTDIYQYISIKDFSPGISDNPGANYPPGSAQRDSTFRCIANRNGALIPLPARSVPFSMPHEVGSTPPGGYALVGLYVPPIPLLPTVLPFNPNTFPEHELFVGDEYITSGNRVQKSYRVRRYEAPGTLFDLIDSMVFVDPSTPPLTAHGMVFGSTRSNRALPNTAGVPVTIFQWVFGASNAYMDEFPDDQAPTVNTPFRIFTNVFLLGFACHQGRTVAQIATAYGHGVNTTTFMGENMRWSAVNDVTPANWLAVPQVFVPENPSGFAFVVGMTANELFAVKINGGMYASGDLNNPTVVTLPMVVGSDVTQTPVATDMGVVYGNGASGVWVWPHGDSSTLLSDKMEPDFWMIVPPNQLDNFGANRYQFSRCDEWVLVPNNWLYDTRLQSWWRLEDDSLFQYRFMTAFSHFIYGAIGFWSNEMDTPVHMWQRGIDATSYSWKSQPQWQTIGNVVDAREITIRAIGTGTVKVTINGESDVPQFVQFQVDTDVPVLYRDNLRVQDANLTIQIESQGNTSAPTVYEVNLGYVAAQHGPVQGTP